MLKILKCHEINLRESLKHFFAHEHSTGIVERNKTLFTYHIGQSYDDLIDFNFEPVFLDETNSLFSNLTLQQEARNICGEYQECLFDIALTGRTNIGEATLRSFTDLRERTNNSQNGKLFDLCKYSLEILF